MYKLSKGDLAVNQSASVDQYAALTNKDLQKNKDLFFQEAESITPTDDDTKIKQPNIPNIQEKPDTAKNAIPIQYNEDGALKYTFDNIYDNKKLAAVARDYYTNRDRETYTDREAIDKFISDRTWNQANTLAMGKEFVYVTGNDFTNDQRARLSYLTRYWDELPDFYEEGGRGASGFFANLGVGILDPLNIIGGGTAGIVTKGVLKKAGQEVVGRQLKKQTKKKAHDAVTKKKL